jgi:phage gp46-like protein
VRLADDRLLTEEDLAGMLRVSLRTERRWRHDLVGWWRTKSAE